jgi:hypothetical protein
MRDKGQAQSAAGRAAGRGALAELAARQHGVVSIRQLTAKLGYSRSAVSRAVESGRLHRLHRGVFAVGHTRLSIQGEALAAVLASGPEAVLSHLSAAWLWGISRSSAAPFSVTTPIRRKPRPPIRLHEARMLTAADRALREGIPVTALPRTLLDLAATVRFDWLEKMFERAEELGLFDLGPVEELLARTVGHHGHRRLRLAIAAHAPSSFTRSSIETRFLELCLDGGLPQPHTNYVEAGFELDCYWPEQRFAVELDLYETHGTRAAFEQDRLRQEELLLAGIAMTRVTGRRLEREPEEVIARVRRLLEQRRG